MSIPDHARLGAESSLVEYPVPAGSHPHDVVPVRDGRIWYTAQRDEAVGWLDPVTGETGQVRLGKGSRSHGVIIGPGGVWISDGGLNAILRVDPESEAYGVFCFPPGQATPI